MRFHVDVGGSPRKVVVERSGTVYQVAVDGRTHIVDVTRVDGHTLSLLLQNGGDPQPVRSVEASIFYRYALGTLDVHVDGHHVPVRLHHGVAALRGREMSSSAAGAGPQNVVAPMPGKVTRVLVQTGDEVRPRQGLVVVEAMKMENELKASRPGRVRDVLVGPGQSVEAGAVLLILE